MFFLLRVAFWLTIVLALLPAGGQQPSTGGPPVGETVAAASAVVTDVSHFCARQPQACAVGSQMAVALGQRAQAGAKMVYDYLHEHWSAAPQTSERRAQAPAKPTSAAAQGTLKPADLAPPWREPERRARHPI